MLLFVFLSNHSYPGIPTSVSWCLNSADGLAFVSQRGPLYIWMYGGPDPGVTMHKEAHSFLSDISLFRWHPTKKGKLVFGHTDGSLSVFQPGILISQTLLLYHRTNFKTHQNHYIICIYTWRRIYLSLTGYRDL